MSDTVLLEVAERIATVTLNRPAARNAMSSELLDALQSSMSTADDRDDVDVIVLTGADPAFCAGLDLKELGGAGSGMTTKAVGRPFAPTRKPVIGAINGVAITGGFELALTCDFLVASERAKFGDTHTRVGIMPGWGLTVLLPQAIGLRRAREMSFTGNFMDAAEALAVGLVNHVVPHDELMPVTLRLAADIVGNDPLGVRQIRRTYAAVHDEGPGRRVEATDAGAWQREAFDPAAVAARRAAIQERGKRQ